MMVAWVYYFNMLHVAATTATVAATHSTKIDYLLMDNQVATSD
jgi:hypothetical protein